METLVTLKVSLVLRPVMEMKERIKQKADELFRQYGIKAITMDEIAGQMGISKKTIYQAYADKDELVDAVITEMIGYNQKCCGTHKAKADNAVHEVFLAMEMIQDMFSNFNPSILFDMQRNHPNTFEKFSKHKNSFVFQVVKDNVKRGIKEELFRGDVNPDVISKIRLETMFLPFNQELFPKNKFNLVDLEKQLIDYYLFGIASLKGYKLILKYQQQRDKALSK